MIPCVDAHIHLWDLQHIRYDWLSAPFSDEGPNGSVEEIAHGYCIADYRADLARWNVVGAVHVDAGAAAASALRETQWLGGWCVFFGFLWGFGGLTYGLTMRYLGLSLGMAVVPGLCTVFGTLIPPIVGEQLHDGDCRHPARTDRPAVPGHHGAGHHRRRHGRRTQGCGTVHRPKGRRRR